MDKEKVQYGIIHEVGEYQDVIPLNEEDNKKVNEVDSKNNNTEK